MTGTSGQEHMSELQITAMKSKNSTSNVYLVLQNHSQLPSLAVHVQQTALLVLKLSNLYVWQVKRMQFEPNFYHLKKKMQYLQKKANQGAPFLLSLSGEDLYTEKEHFIKYLYQVKKNKWLHCSDPSFHDKFPISNFMHFLFPGKRDLSFTSI